MALSEAARRVLLVKQFPLTVGATELARQLVGAAASVGANVEEAHGAESQSVGDFFDRIDRIDRIFQILAMRSS